MGNRVKGHPKKKGIKAALSSNAGSKRKLSRMGKKQKRDHAGLDATFIGRSKCLSLLQINLKDFRRLCILKGVYPREPLKAPGKKKGQTYYHIKDVRAIAHEPVLEKFRDFQAFMKKVRRAAGRHDKDEALRRNALLPTYTLHHLVKERYPRFQDALSDMDDALTLTYLFASLPGQGHLSAKVTNKAKSLAAAWGAYCATTSSITKSFISVKGVYLEACIQGVDIRWIIPHAFTQFLPTDVDYRVMMTFFEFYETLLNFVLFKLYSDIGVRFPLSVQSLLGDEAAATGAGSTSSVLAANLRALTHALDSAKSGSAIRNVIAESVSATTTNDKKLDTSGKANEEKKDAATKTKTSKKDKQLIASVGAALSKLASEDSDADKDSDDEEEDEDVAGPLKAALDSMTDEQAKESLPGGAKNNAGAAELLDSDAVRRKGLFRGLVFFLSREIPRGYLELVCLAHGAKVVGWQGDDDGKSPIAMNDSSITHHICDRPRLPQQYDSLPKSREYVQPQWILDCANFMFLLPIARYAIGATLPPHLSPWVDDEEEGYKPAYAEEVDRLKNGEAVDLSVDVMKAAETGSTAIQDEGHKSSTSREAAATDSKKDADVAEEQDDDDDEEEEEEEDEESEKARERREKKRRKEEQEAHDLAKTMMSRKASHLYDRMQHGISQKNKKVEELQKKRQEIEGRQKKKNGGGGTAGTSSSNNNNKSVLKQKVERLKKERKEVEDTYSNTTGTMKKSKKRRTK